MPMGTMLSRKCRHARSHRGIPLPPRLARVARAQLTLRLPQLHRSVQLVRQVQVQCVNHHNEPGCPDHHFFRLQQWYYDSFRFLRRFFLHQQWYYDDFCLHRFFLCQQCYPNDCCFLRRLFRIQQCCSNGYWFYDGCLYQCLCGHHLLIFANIISNIRYRSRSYLSVSASPTTVALSTASSTGTGTPPVVPVGTSTVSSPTTSVSPTETAAGTTATAAPDAVASASDTSSAALASGSAAAASASTSAAAAFTLPGRKLSVLPIGLGVFAGISVIALIVVGLVTYERTKYRKVRFYQAIVTTSRLMTVGSFFYYQQFRARKLAEAGAPMGYGAGNTS
ncbi:hypothetical protein BJ912DRAFT_589106 [Pholiota molesta]|nr:hypothetical protein BJ912DRAFT_589106 [Pholiota molesta]